MKTKHRICNPIILPLLLTALFLTAPAYTQDAPDKDETLFYQISARLLVKDRQAAADSLSRWAEEQNGYFTIKNLEQIEFRLPARALAGLMPYLEEISEELVDYNQNSQDLREQLLSSRSALEAREEILSKNISYISSSDVEGTLTLEREIRRLMNEIDMYRGILRKIENDRRYARISVMLSFRNQSIPDSRPSSFDWINRVDFYSFMGQNILSGKAGFGGPAITLPEGFALVDKSPDFLALSPEGIRLRVKRFDNYPEKAGKFWQEALFSYLSEKGYLAMKSITAVPDKLELGGETFITRTWGVPYGNEDYLYMTGLRIVKKKIELVEIAGPASYVKEYF